MNTLTEIADAIRDAKSVVVSSHVSPDADAIGSSAALALGLTQMKINATVALDDDIPEKIAELVPAAIFHQGELGKSYDLLIVVDTATRRRVSLDMDKISSRFKRVLNLDHHVSNELWADLNYIESEAAASAEIILALLKELGLKPDTDIANLLYAGLADDTGVFRFSNTTAGTLECAAELVRCGASPVDVANVMYFSVPERVFRLRALAISNLEVVLDGKIAVVSVTNNMLNECHAKAEDTEGIVDLARSLKGTIGAVFIRQLEKGWKASLRSKLASFDVNAVAAQFGGGGHTAAAGCKVNGTLDEAKSQLLAAVEKQLAAPK